MLPLTSTLFSPGVQPFLHANMLVSPCLCWMCSCNDFNKFYVQPSQHGYTWSLTKFLIPPEFYTSFSLTLCVFSESEERNVHFLCVHFSNFRLLAKVLCTRNDSLFLSCLQCFSIPRQGKEELAHRVQEQKRERWQRNELHKSRYSSIKHIKWTINFSLSSDLRSLVCCSDVMRTVQCIATYEILPFNLSVSRLQLHWLSLLFTADIN